MSHPHNEASEKGQGTTEVNVVPFHPLGVEIYSTGGKAAPP